jgi:hypothetical protein
MIVMIIIIINKYFVLKTDHIEHGSSDGNTYDLFSGYAMFQSRTTANECYI